VTTSRVGPLYVCWGLGTLSRKKRGGGGGETSSNNGIAKENLNLSRNNDSLKRCSKRGWGVCSPLVCNFGENESTKEVFLKRRGNPSGQILGESGR